VGECLIAVLALLATGEPPNQRVQAWCAMLMVPRPSSDSYSNLGAGFGNHFGLAVYEGYDLDSLVHRIVVFLLGVADPIRRKASVSTAKDQKIVVAIVDDPLDELKLFFISRREQLHTSRYAIHLHDGLHDVLPFLG
jgi:hypothetical protein